MNLMAAITKTKINSIPAGEFNTGTKVELPNEDIETVSLPKESPNRNEPTDTLNIVEVLSDAADKISNLSAQFEGENMILVTNFNAPAVTTRMTTNNIEVPEELDEVLTFLKKKLSDAGHSGVKFKTISVETTPDSYTYRNRNVTFNVKGVFQIEA
jgi:hypothetical protein